MGHPTSRVVPVLGLTAHLGRGMQRVATDAVIGRMRSLPRAVRDLDAPSLSKVMGRRVTSVSVIGGDAGTSSRARLALSGGGDVPASVFVKMPAETIATRLMGELGRLAQTEVLFYRELSPRLTGVPTAYGSAFDSLTGRFVLVLEDLAVDSCIFPDTLHPLDDDQAAKIVELLATLHATFWERPPAWVCSASGDHTSLLTGPLLNTSARRLAERTSIAVEDGRFIIFPGYEWSGNTGLGGDRNVMFMHEGRQIHRSSHALVDDIADVSTDSNSAEQLFQALKGEDCVVFAHIGGRYADIKMAHDARIERSVEVHSDWGTFEWLVEDALEQGYRIGVVVDEAHHGFHGDS